MYLEAARVPWSQRTAEIECKSTCYPKRTGRPLELQARSTPWKVSKKAMNRNSNLVASFDGAIGFFEHFGDDVRRLNSLNLTARWPNISQENIFPVGILSQRFGLKVDINTAGQGIGDNQQW